MLKKTGISYYEAYTLTKKFPEDGEHFVFWKEFSTTLKELYMDFVTMVKSIKKGQKSYRSSWKNGELLWKKDGLLVHNFPYMTKEGINEQLGGYIYVCEEGDIAATDWVIFDAEL